jgi:hypothetical protein
MPDIPEEAVECTNAICDAPATRIMAMALGSVPCHFIAPYCDAHAQAVAGEGGLPAAGPALSEAAREIEGIR